MIISLSQQVFENGEMTNSTAAALLLRDLILDKENPYEPLFSPQRKNLKAQIKNLIFYDAQVAFELLKGKSPNTSEKE